MKERYRIVFVDNYWRVEKRGWFGWRHYYDNVTIHFNYFHLEVAKNALVYYRGFSIKLEAVYYRILK